MVGLKKAKTTKTMQRLNLNSTGWTRRTGSWLEGLLLERKEEAQWVGWTGEKGAVHGMPGIQYASPGS